MTDTNPDTGRERWSRVEVWSYAAELDQGDDGEWLWWVVPVHIPARDWDALDVAAYFPDTPDVDVEGQLTAWQREVWP
jgi:hypothetical protein